MRKNFSIDGIYPDEGCDILSCLLVIAREHDGLDSERFEIFDRLSCFVLYGICDSEYCLYSYSIGKENRSLPLLRETVDHHLII